MHDWGFLSLTKTKRLLDPYFRFKLFSGAKFDPKKFEEDKIKILDYYNSIGYRDAQIVADTTIITPGGNLNVERQFGTVGREEIRKRSVTQALEMLRRLADDHAVRA